MNLDLPPYHAVLVDSVPAIQVIQDENVIAFQAFTYLELIVWVRLVQYADPELTCGSEICYYFKKSTIISLFLKD